MTSFAAVILAAGKSTRMKSSVPKALHPVAGLPMIVHILGALEKAGAARIVVVVGHGADQVRSVLGDRVEFVEQSEQRGTGHAAQMTRPLLQDWQGPIIVLPGDAPLITPDAITALLKTHASNAITLLSIELERPTGYGRIVRSESGSVASIVEEKDATDEQRAIREVNVSIYAFEPAFLFNSLSLLQPNNVQGEYYLTDTVSLAHDLSREIAAITWHDPNVGRGVNTRVELSEVNALFHQRILREHMLAGVSIIDPHSTRIEAEVNIGADTTIHPFTVLRGVTDIGESCEIGPGARIDDAKIGNKVTVRDSWIVASEVGDDTKIGPYANIRPNSTIGRHVKIGDFVEVKSSKIEDNAKAGHFAYLGDAEVGEDSNIGAGTITCNFDGKNKHKTVIGKRVFTGSNSTLVAPLNIADDAYIAAGSTITEDLPAGALGIGRARQVTKPEWVMNRRAKMAEEDKQ